MTLLHLSILYALAGLGGAAGLVARRGRATSPLDAALVALLWPLYGPFLLLQEAPEAAPQATRARRGAPAEAAFDARERAGGAPLAELLPDAQAGRRLERRLAQARRRVDEINALLDRTSYCVEDVRARQQHLRAQGDEASARMVGQRLQLIERLARMRERFAREITQISELLTQLELQAEVIRLSGGDDPTQELVDELMIRVQSLDELLDEEELLEGASARR